MFKATQQKITPEIIKYKITANEQPLTYRSWITYLKTSIDFVDFFVDLLKASNHTAFFWEVKPVNIKAVSKDFEFVLVKSNSLPNIKADEFTFQKYFTEDQQVVNFSNLGGDAELIVPTPIGKPDDYAHLAVFLRNAPQDQIQKFWQTIAIEFESRINEKTVWLSTAGLGVSWLHVRIDSRPKYYRFQAYKQPRT